MTGMTIPNRENVVDITENQRSASGRLEDKKAPLVDRPTVRMERREASPVINQVSYDEFRREEKMGRLGVLLTRAQAYSKFLADRLQEQILPTLTEPGVTKRRRAKVSVSGQEEVPAGFKQPSLVTGGKLRSYQLEGVQWLISLFENGLNGILADEMGLGKTVQCISFLAFLREQGISGPFLIVAPLSTLTNWVGEFERFAPSIPAVLYHGSISERGAIRKKYLNGSRGGNRLSVVVTSYELAMNDARFLGPISWKYLVIDEGHRLKNLNCRLIRELKSYKSDNRLLITGTPLHNNLTELWSLLNFLLPQIFADVDDFLSWFDFDFDEPESGSEEAPPLASIEHEQADMIEKLHAILKPLLLRRLKTDVEKELPKKREYILSAALSPLQREYYQAVWSGRIRDIVVGGDSAKRGPSGSSKRERKRSKPTSYRELEESDIDSQEEGFDCLYRSEDAQDKVSTSVTSCSAGQGLQNRVMQLRKVCNHPYLFNYPTHKRDPTRLLVDEQLVRCSGKVRLLDQLLGELCRRGHRVLIFSQMSRMLDILGDYLVLRKREYCRIDGSVPHVQRQDEIRRFNDDESCAVFLLSTRAGGLGLNLVAADTVIFFDSDWNPQIDLQAQDRVHRIGQNRPVLIFRLSTSGTVEERMLERAASKRKLERLVIHKRKFKGRDQLSTTDDRLCAEELEEILKGVGEGEGTQFPLAGATAELTSSELEAILDRSEAALARATWSTDRVQTVPT